MYIPSPSTPSPLHDKPHLVEHLSTMLQHHIQRWSGNGTVRYLKIPIWSLFIVSNLTYWFIMYDYGVWLWWCMIMAYINQYDCVLNAWWVHEMTKISYRIFPLQDPLCCCTNRQSPGAPCLVFQVRTYSMCLWRNSISDLKLTRT